MKKIFLVFLLALSGCLDSDKSATVTAKDGVNGLAGSSCSTTQNSSGATVSCSDGTTAELKNGVSLKGDRGEVGATGVGLQGAAGKNSLIKTYTATIAQCANGGLVIDTFTDVNGNNNYDAGDTNYQRSLLCNAVVTVTTVETQDEHHEKYHHSHKHDKTKDSDCESGKLDN